jgi:hypothetical protein
VPETLAASAGESERPKRDRFPEIKIIEKVYNGSEKVKMKRKKL